MHMIRQRLFKKLTVLCHWNMLDETGFGYVCCVGEGFGFLAIIPQSAFPYYPLIAIFLLRILTRFEIMWLIEHAVMAARLLT